MIDIPLLMTENDSPVFYSYISILSALGDVCNLVTRSITRRTSLAYSLCVGMAIYTDTDDLPETTAACAVLSFTHFYIPSLAFDAL